MDLLVIESSERLHTSTRACEEGDVFVSGQEHRVAGFVDRLVDDRALIGGGVEMQR